MIYPPPPRFTNHRDTDDIMWYIHTFLYQLYVISTPTYAEFLANYNNDNVALYNARILKGTKTP